MSKIIGLTGGIACGKSTISNYLIMKNIPLIDADIICKNILDNNIDLLQKIRHFFGEQYFTNNTLDKKKFGNMIFNDKEKKQKYEKLILPIIIKEIFNKIDYYKSKNEDIIVVDAPTLYENNLDKYMDFIVVVYVNEETQLERIIKRDNLSENNAKNRIKNQMDLDLKKQKANFLIYGNDNKEELIKNINKYIINNTFY